MQGPSRAPPGILQGPLGTSIWVNLCGFPILQSSTQCSQSGFTQEGVALAQYQDKISLQWLSMEKTMEYLELVTQPRDGVRYVCPIGDVDGFCQLHSLDGSITTCISALPSEIFDSVAVMQEPATKRRRKAAAAKGATAATSEAIVDMVQEQEEVVQCAQPWNNYIEVLAKSWGQARRGSKKEWGSRRLNPSAIKQCTFKISPPPYRRLIDFRPPPGRRAGDGCAVGWRASVGLRWPACAKAAGMTCTKGRRGGRVGEADLKTNGQCSGLCILISYITTAFFVAVRVVGDAVWDHAVQRTPRTPISWGIWGCFVMGALWGPFNFCVAPLDILHEVVKGLCLSACPALLLAPKAGWQEAEWSCNGETYLMGSHRRA